METLYIISCQAKEWYGDEAHIGDPAHGRYKMKGSEDFVIGMDHDMMTYDGEMKIIADFNKKYDKVGRYWRYEAKSIEWYNEPVIARFVDGEVVIPYTDPLDKVNV